MVHFSLCLEALSRFSLLTDQNPDSLVWKFLDFLCTIGASLPSNVCSDSFLTFYMPPGSNCLSRLRSVTYLKPSLPSFNAVCNEGTCHMWPFICLTSVDNGTFFTGFLTSSCSFLSALFLSLCKHCIHYKLKFIKSYNLDDFNCFIILVA